jgi:hypothetical protein
MTAGTSESARTRLAGTDKRLLRDPVGIEGEPDGDVGLACVELQRADLMAKLTDEQIEERVLGFIDRETGRNARISAGLAIGNPPTDTTRAHVASKYGSEIYSLVEDEAMKARDGLVRVLEHCGVRFDDKAFRALFDVTLDLAMASVVAAVTVLRAEALDGG